MATTIAIPTAASVGGFSTEVAAASVTKSGNYEASIANALITLATSAGADVTAVHANLPIQVRGVCTSNMSLTAFVGVSGGTPQDGVTYAAGEYTLLAGQTSKAANGIYQVGTVGGGTAALTRIAQIPAAAVLKSGFTVNVSEGTIFANTNWFIATTGSITVGTTAHDWYPERVTVSQVLTSGTAAAITSIPLLSATKSNILYTRTATGGTLTLTVGYQTVPAPTIGIAGTASIVPMAVVAAGTIQNVDGSTLLVTVINR